MGILLIVFPFSISSTYFRKSRSRWKPYGVSTEYGGFPLTPFSFVFGGKLLPGGVKTRHQCLFRGNILRIFFFTFLFFHHVPVFSLTNRFFSLISEKRKNQITSQTAIKHKHSRREYPEISRGKITFYLRFHWNLSHNSVLLLFLHLSSPALFFSHSCCFISSRLLLFNGDGPDFHLITALPWTGAGNSLKVFRPTGTFNSHRQEHRRPLLWLALFLAETFVPLLHVESSFTWLRCLFPFSGVWSRIFPAPLVAVRDRCTPELFSWPPASAAAPKQSQLCSQQTNTTKFPCWALCPSSLTRSLTGVNKLADFAHLVQLLDMKMLY